MKMLITKIGDFFIHIMCESKNLRTMLEKNFHSYIPTENVQSDIVINIEDGFGVSFQNYNVDIRKDNNQILYLRADYLIKVDSDYKTANITVHDELALKHALMNLFSSFIVYHNWGLLIHSSCVIENEKAHIFAGQSGAGKSTAAKLSYPRNLLSDEATLVKITEEDVQIYNSPFRSEIEADSFSGNLSLASVQILFQALQNKREKVAKSDALFQLMDKVFFWPQSQEETRRIMNLMTLLVKQVPVYNLYFQKNNSFWELIS